jgi:multiple sugar transport system ATP-binding protein
MAQVTLQNISKNFGKTEAVKDLSLDIADGEFVVLLGPTGAGKTTTLRLIAGLEKPDQGSVSIGGQPMASLTPASRNVAFVFQAFSLYPHLSVYDNLAFPMRAPARRVAEDEIKKRVERVAELLRIPHKLQNKSTQLSGGEMQRVAIGRALVRDPSIYLMDEPLSSLDAKLRGELRIELKRIQQELGSTLLYVTHDQIEAMTMATRIGVLNEGKLVQIGTPREIFENPNSIYVAQKLGQPHINIIPGALAGVERVHMVGARTEHMKLTKTSKGEAKIDWIERLGDQARVHITWRDQSLVTLAEPGSDLEAGDTISIAFLQPLYFDQNGNRIS